MLRAGKKASPARKARSGRPPSGRPPVPGSGEVPPAVLSWLLEPSEPSMRFLALTQLLGRPEQDPEVRESRRDIPRTGWAAEVLSGRDPAGWWEGPESLYEPKYRSTHWRLLVLSDLGLTRSHPGIRRSCEVWMDRFPLTGGGVGGNSKGHGHHCVVGNMVRALVQFGYGADPRLRTSLEWLVETADPKGGWSCFGRGRNLDSWEGLSAFAAYPRDLWTPAMTMTVDRAAEFFLDRELHRQGEDYAPWYRFHYPVHYYYDLLVGLEVLSALGRGQDPRLAFAWDLLERKRRPDGRWVLDAVHPDVEGRLQEWFRSHPSRRPTPLALEPVGQPSKMITFRALRALKRAGRLRDVPA